MTKFKMATVFTAQELIFVCKNKVNTEFSKILCKLMSLIEENSFFITNAHTQGKVAKCKTMEDGGHLGC